MLGPTVFLVTAHHGSKGKGTWSKTQVNSWSGWDNLWILVLLEIYWK